MSRYDRQIIFRHIVTLLAIPLVLTGTGYALFSQQLSVNTTTTKPSYSTSNNMLFTYTRSLGTQGQKTVYTITGTVTNQGTASVTGWLLNFSLPTDFGGYGCGATVVCSTSGTTATVANGTGNGSIAPGGSVTFTVTFNSTASTNYTLQNISIAGSVAVGYQTISGLTVTASAGTRTKSGKWYYWPYTFTVTNNSGSAISAWRILAPWNSSTNAVNSMPANVNYVVAATQLTILSTTGMANNTSFQFTASLGSTSSTWVLTGYTIQGAL